jgi:hypothetical protein
MPLLQHKINFSPIRLLDCLRAIHFMECTKMTKNPKEAATKFLQDSLNYKQQSAEMWRTGHEAESSENRKLVECGRQKSSGVH